MNIVQFIGETKEKALLWAEGWVQDNVNVTPVSIKYQPAYVDGKKIERYVIEYKKGVTLEDYQKLGRGRQFWVKQNLSNC